MSNRKGANRLKSIIAIIAAICVVFVMSATNFAVYAESGSRPNLEKAMAQYGVSENYVYEASADIDLKTSIARAKTMLTGSNKVIFYIPSGTYTLTSHLEIPTNMVMVGETDSIVKASTSDYPDNRYLIRLSGSMYGGTFDSNYNTQTTIRILENSNGFSANNGRIEHLKVLRSSYYGIVAQGSKGSVINDCTVTKCKASGISALKPSSASAAGDTKIKSITNCNISNNGEKGEGAGINLSFADIGIIDKCTINSNADKAVSTNSDNKTGCHIGMISNCTMKKNVNNGVHIKPNCRLDHFVNNKLIGNDDGLIAAAITKEGTKGKSIIKDVRGNTFKSSVTQQIEAQGKGASITIGNNNKILSGRQHGILVMAYGKVAISGSNNVIKGNFKGLGAQTSGSIKVTGKNNQIINNKDRGIRAAYKGIVTIAGKGNKIKGNKKGAVYSSEKSKVTLKKVKISGKIYKASGGKVIKK